MRQIGIVSDAFQARTLADHLLTLRIETQVHQDTDGYSVWVCDEDRVAQAKQEFDAFIANPRDPRYAVAAPAADAIRREEDETERDYGRRQTELREMMAAPRMTGGSVALTVMLMAIAVVVAVATDFVADDTKPIPQALFITSFQVRHEGSASIIRWHDLNDITHHGQVWRLITPIFLHFNIFHLLFDVLVLFQLGSAFEFRRGTLRYAAFIVVTAAASNVGQYYFGWVAHFSEWSGPHQLNPLFGGLSGVDYALFGYLWMKSRYEPELGFHVPPNVVVLLIAWLLLCFTGAVGPIGNICHVVGLGLGMLIGVAPTWWRRMRMRFRPSDLK